MKKKSLVLSILLTICVLVCPITANAASGAIFGASAYDSSTKTFLDENTTLNGNTVAIENKGDNTKIYLGVNVTSGTFDEYNATVKLSDSNFTFKNFSRNTTDGWVNTTGTKGIWADETDPSIIHISLKNQRGGVTTGKHLVATINLNVSDTAQSTDKCTITLSSANAPEENPKCQIDGDKYYCANGEECTKAEYDEICKTPTENPQTGSFLPYAVIIGGLAVAAGLYMVTKKNKIYHI